MPEVDRLIETPVLIVGAGPAGMAVGLVLDRFGIDHPIESITGRIIAVTEPQVLAGVPDDDAWSMRCGNAADVLRHPLPPKEAFQRSPETWGEA